MGHRYEVWRCAAKDDSRPQFKCVNIQEAFYADMGDPPQGASLERIDNDGPYAPENCRWATAREQVLNRRRTVFLRYGSVTKPLAEWAADLGLSHIVLHNRIKRGWSVARAVTTPGRAA